MRGYGWRSPSRQALVVNRVLLGRHENDHENTKERKHEKRCQTRVAIALKLRGCGCSPSRARLVPLIGWRPSVALEGGVRRPAPNIRRRAGSGDRAQHVRAGGRGRETRGQHTPDRRSPRPQFRRCRSPHRPLRGTEAQRHALHRRPALHVLVCLSSENRDGPPHEDVPVLLRGWPVRAASGRGRGPPAAEPAVAEQRRQADARQRQRARLRDRR
jgi:hypothetical protein